MTLVINEKKANKIRSMKENPIKIITNSNDWKF